MTSPDVRYVQGDFQGVEPSSAAIRELKAQGLTVADLDVFSTEPILYPAGVLDRPSRMSLAAVLGAMSFLVLIVLFVYYTQHAYPLVTGGMPIFSFWSTGVVFYEITMLGAILTTFVVFLLESGVLRRGSGAPVPVVSPGLICLRVRCDAEGLPRVSESLSRAGAVNVRAMDGSA